jgi:hypothetical protein
VNRRPIAPAPRTTAFSPAAGFTRCTALTTQANGSVRAAISRGSWSETLMEALAGMRTLSARPPSRHTPRSCRLSKWLGIPDRQARTRPSVDAPSRASRTYLLTGAAIEGSAV